MSKSESQIVTLDTKLARLDTFAAENGLASLVEGKGQFSKAIAVANAMNTLRNLLDDDLMKEFLKLQGSPLGFKTDKDRDGGYSVDVVREVLIEATIKGFELTNNQTNVIGARFYPTKEGFEGMFKRLSQRGLFSDLRMTQSVPKMVGEEAHVSCTAAFKFRKTNTEEWKSMLIPAQGEPALVISIRVNKGQGSDAILGKAKRKTLARIYELITGTEITDGDVDEAAEKPAGAAGAGAIDITTKPAALAAPAEMDLDTLDAVSKVIGDNGDLATAYFLQEGHISEGQNWRKINLKQAARVLKHKDAFLQAIGAK
jgi:hypothetical protein